jgi:hypothetical protein
MHAVDLEVCKEKAKDGVHWLILTQDHEPSKLQNLKYGILCTLKRFL